MKRIAAIGNQRELKNQLLLKLGAFGRSYPDCKGVNLQKCSMVILTTTGNIPKEWGKVRKSAEKEGIVTVIITNNPDRHRDNADIVISIEKQPWEIVKELLPFL